MYSRCNKIARNLQVATFVLGAVLLHRAEASPVMKVCVDQANPTHTMDARVARAALKTQGIGFKEVMFIGHGKRADVPFPIKKFAEMAKDECQLIMGFPVDVDGPELPPNVKSTAPYASTGFVLVETRGEKPFTLDTIPKNTQMGIAQVNTWAGLLFRTHPNMVMNVYETDKAMLGDLEKHKIDAAMTWQPFLEAFENTKSKHALLASEMLPGDHMIWNLVALYAPGSEAAADTFAKGIDALRSGGKLEPLVSPYEAAVEMKGKASAEADQHSQLQREEAVAMRRGHLIKVAEKKPAPPPALYTEKQATSGQIKYYQNCAMCHGPNLGGQDEGFSGPALKGSDFADPSYDFHVSDIFNFVANMMPAMSPGSLPHDVSVQIMAFLLKENGYPAGKTELTYDSASKSKVPILYYGKKDASAN